VREPPSIPVTVVTGFLGAGKTTLLNAWLAEHARDDVAVIVNEHGAIGIDGELLAGRAGSIVEIDGGCVCCATQAELARALAELAHRATPPKRIFVETSGAASPAGVLRAILRGAARDALRLDGIVTIVDAARTHVIAAHDLAAEQVGYADVLVLSRADELDDERLDAARAELAARNGTAIVASASRGALRDPGALSLDALLARRGGDFRILAHPPAGTADHGRIESVALAHAGELDEDRFGAWVEAELARVEGRLMRMKGILAIAGIDERMILQGVADHAEVTFGAPWGTDARTSRLVLVGFGLDRAELEAGFRACGRG